MKLKFDLLTRTLMTLLMVGISILAWSQRTVMGSVTDANTGEPLIGANVLVVGTSAGTITDFDGKYSIDVPSGTTQLEFSYTGYSSQTVNLEASNVVNIALSAGTLLEEVVVVGYGSVRKRDATGAVASFGEDEFNRGVITSPEQLLQGRAAGVQITNASGEPGAGMNIRIRGTSSVRSNNSPLFVVDGVPLDGRDITSSSETVDFGNASQRNPLNFLNPDDIEKIDILKDASAAAIYGSRGANGVVLITTKSGKAGQRSLSFSMSGSASTISNKLDLLSGSEYVDAAVRAGATAQNVNFGSQTDWQDEIFRTGFTQNYAVSYGGGNDDTRYRFSLSYMDQEGIIENSGLKRLSGRINATHELFNDRLTLGIQLTASQLDDNYAPITNDAGFEGSLIGAALQANPTRPVTDSNGDFQQSNDYRNPAAMLEYIKSTGESTRLLGNVNLDLKLTDWMSYKLNFGLDNASGIRRFSMSPDFVINRYPDGIAQIDNRYLSSNILEHTLNFKKDFTSTRMDAVVGFSYQEFENRGHKVEAQFFPTDEIPLIDNIDGANNSGSNKAFTGASDRNVDELQSFFGRLNYSIRDKYMLTGTLRADGSSKFGENNKYGYFPSFAVAWRIIDEGFLPDLFYDFKLRAGWGITGNQEFPGGISKAAYQLNNDGSLTLRATPNPDIKWEETSQINVGLDFGFLKGRLLGTIDYFNKKTTDLIIQQFTAQPAPTDYVWKNLPGEVINSGVELTLDFRAIEGRKFDWQIMANGSILKNEVQNLGTFVNTGRIHGQGLTGAYAQRIADGQPLYAFFMRRFSGFDSEGFAVYQNGDVLEFVGSPFPDITFGLTNNFTFNNLDLSIFLNGSFGQEIYNNTANAIFLKGNLRNGRNVTKELADSPENPLNFGEVSTRFLEDGSFVRLANMQIGYNLKPANKNIRNVRIYLAAQNLFVITDYTGFDPEVNTNKAIENVPSLNIDYTPYPASRTFTLGVNLGF